MGEEGTYGGFFFGLGHGVYCVEERCGAEDGGEMHCEDESKGRSKDRM